MLQFHPIFLKDQDWITPYYQKRDCPAAQYTFASSFIWSVGYQVGVCEDEGYFFLRYEGGDSGHIGYRCPLGFDGDEGLRRAVEKLMAYCRAEGESSLLLHNVPPEETAALHRIFGDRLISHESRDDYEYLYDRQALAELKGSKYHGKRGHIKQFLATDWRYETLTPERIPDVLLMHSEWCRLNDCGKNPELCREGMAVREALDHFTELGLRGGLLYQDGRVVAYTIGEPAGGGAFAVHFEKAYGDVQGAYPAINQLFVQREMADFSLVNREEDTGSEGLRKAKLSYHPVSLLELMNLEIPLE